MWLHRWLLALPCVLGGAGAWPPESPPLTSGAIPSNASESNTTLLQPNATLDDATAVEADALLRRCELWIPAAYVHLAALPIWFVLVITWSLYCLRHQSSVKDLHKLLTWAPCVELLHSLLSYYYFRFCPWRTIAERILGACWVVVSILKEPILLVCLLMLSKGWCITRPHLQYREMVYSSLLISLLYICVIYELSARGVGSAVPAIILSLVMLYAVVAAIVTNLRVLKAQLLIVHAFGIDATTTPAYAKYHMFWALLYPSTIFFLSDMTLNLLEALDVGAPWLLTLLRQSLELVTTALFGWLFRPRHFNALFEQVQELVQQAAAEVLPQFATVTVDVEVLRGDGRLPPWSADLDFATASSRASSRGDALTATAAAVVAAAAGRPIGSTPRATPCATTPPAGPVRSAQYGAPLAPPHMLVVLNPGEAGPSLGSADENDKVWKEAMHRSLAVAMRLVRPSEHPVSVEGSGSSSHRGGVSGWGRRGRASRRLHPVGVAEPPPLIPMASMTELIGVRIGGQPREPSSPFRGWSSSRRVAPEPAPRSNRPVRVPSLGANPEAWLP